MKLSVIILNYNVSHFLRQCVLSTQEALQEIESEIIIVDNNSQDDSCEMVKTHFPNLKLIENKENVGFSKANNQGVAIAKGEYVCILNPDTAVAKDTFKNVLDFAQQKKDFGALGVRLIDGTGNFLPESKRNIPIPQVAFNKIINKKSKKNSYYATHIDEFEIASVQVLSGAFMLIKKSVYKQVNGFDEDYFMYGEDIDLSYKIIKAQYKNYYYGKTTILHYKGESTTKDQVYLKRFYGAMLLFYKKHLNANPFVKPFIFVGVNLVKFLRFFKLKNKQAPLHSPKNYIVITQNNPFINQLKKTKSNTFQNLTKTQAYSLSPQQTYIVFDTNYLPYQNIFELMALYKNQHNQFRIKPFNTQYILGSDSSDSKGEVLSL